ncbi:MAG: tripartite tricarboxylate transporter substrate binding protein [Pseudomonadota bacterium]
MKILGTFIAIAIALTGIVAPAAAADYPTGPIKIVVPYPAGGTADIFARIIGAELSKAFHHPVFVDDRAGAGGNIGSDIVAKAAPNGHTLLLGSSGSNAVNPSLFKQMPYNAWTDLVLVAPVASAINVLVVGAGHKAKSVADLLAMAKAKPDSVTFGSSGNGSVLHLSGVMLANMSGTKMIHVPYKGTPPALLDVLTSRVDFMFANAPSVVSDIKAGKLRALAVSTKYRMKELPDVPTLDESGMKGYDLSSWWAVFAPAKTPPAIVEKLNAAIRKTLNEPAIEARFESMGSKPLIMGAEESQKFFLSELKLWGDLVKASGATVN